MDAGASAAMLGVLGIVPADRPFAAQAVALVLQQRAELTASAAAAAAAAAAANDRAAAVAASMPGPEGGREGRDVDRYAVDLGVEVGGGVESIGAVDADRSPADSAAGEGEKGGKLRMVLTPGRLLQREARRSLTPVRTRVGGQRERERERQWVDHGGMGLPGRAMAAATASAAAVTSPNLIAQGTRVLSHSTSQPTASLLHTPSESATSALVSTVTSQSTPTNAQAGSTASSSPANTSAGRAQEQSVTPPTVAPSSSTSSLSPSAASPSGAALSAVMKAQQLQAFLATSKHANVEGSSSHGSEHGTSEHGSSREQGAKEQAIVEHGMSGVDEGDPTATKGNPVISPSPLFVGKVLRRSRTNREQGEEGGEAMSTSSSSLLTPPTAGRRQVKSGPLTVTVVTAEEGRGGRDEVRPGPYGDDGEARWKVRERHEMRKQEDADQVRRQDAAVEGVGRRSRAARVSKSGELMRVSRPTRDSRGMKLGSSLETDDIGRLKASVKEQFRTASARDAAGLWKEVGHDGEKPEKSEALTRVSAHQQLTVQEAEYMPSRQVDGDHAQDYGARGKELRLGEEVAGKEVIDNDTSKKGSQVWAEMEELDGTRLGLKSLRLAKKSPTKKDK